MVSLAYLLLVATTSAAVHATTAVATAVATHATTAVVASVAGLTSTTLTSTINGHAPIKVAANLPKTTLEPHADTYADAPSAKPTLSTRQIAGISVGAFFFAAMVFSVIRWYLSRHFKLRDAPTPEDLEKGAASPTDEGSFSVYSPQFVPSKGPSRPAPARVTEKSTFWLYITTRLSLDSTPPAHTLENDYVRTEAEALAQSYQRFTSHSGFNGDAGDHVQPASGHSAFEAAPSPVKTVTFPSTNKTRHSAPSRHCRTASGALSIANSTSSSDLVPLSDLRRLHLIPSSSATPYSSPAPLTALAPARALPSGVNRSRAPRRAFHAL